MISYLATAYTLLLVLWLYSSNTLVLNLTGTLLKVLNCILLIDIVDIAFC